MSFDAGDIDNRWICSRAAALNLQRVSTMVREIRDPCINRSPPTVKKMLKPEKWQALFDNEGKISGFRRALKLITMGGVDPSIRPEVWEFLLGCYSLGSNAEYRKQLRMARRERYDDLIKECQTMHSSIGTGTLAYVIGSRVMDVRNLSKDNNREDNSTPCRDDNDVMIQKVAHSDLGNNGEVLHFNQREISIDSDVTSVKGSSNFVGSEPSYDICTSDTCNCSSTYSGYEMEEFDSQTENFFGFPSLPVTNLFEKSSHDEEGWNKKRGPQSNSECKKKESLCSCRNNSSFDPEEASSTKLSCMSKSEGGTFDSVAKKRTEEKKEEFDMVRMSTSLEVGTMTTSLTRGPTARKDRVSEWLWTLHRNVVDVVRTDNHLEFYEDSKNMARMSNILAVYAWVDPATGYCQGMSDLLSPFVVLYEDDADAFWCFEMLLRRLRENFQMDGPTGVMKQLQALWKILEMTDAEMFAHLSLIGAESLHFAFRMLLVLFRRELSFNDALCMWEMMWAADFDEAVTRGLEASCLEPLVLQIPEDSSAGRREKDIENGKLKPEIVDSDDSDVEIASSQNNGAKSESSLSRYPFCGLTSASFWARHEELQICTVSTSTRKTDDELPVFCVAAILIINRQKILRKTHSIDDVIKMFNDNLLKINVKRCVRMAIKLRKKYFYKTKHINVGHSETK